MGDYLRCPRSYYLRNVYRDQRNNHRMTLMQPALALGQVVHEVIEALSILPVEERLNRPLLDEFDNIWLQISGEKGGFADLEEEKIYKDRGRSMMARVQAHPGPIGRKATKIRDPLPNFLLSEEDNIILCGKIDWLEYDEITDSIYVLDFKTGKMDERPDSLQLPIYYLLASACQKRPVIGLRYWYIDRDDNPVDMPLPDKVEGKNRILEVARSIALARKLDRFLCRSKDGCSACRPMEAIIAGKGKFVGESEFHQDIYILPSPHERPVAISESRRPDDLPF
ncbi:PD-(D/E)XK nuclease family protein [Candidatus Gottesmanbacteria bacterium]|nr:PD-(D/E)XK nuclease family protein [Candidatus Gottesmanbacteria bacterium]